MQVDSHETIFSVLEKIKASLSEGVEVTLEIPSNNDIFGNLLTLRFLQEQVRRLGGTLNFVGQDERGENLVKALTGSSSLGFAEGVDVAEAQTPVRRFGFPRLTTIPSLPVFRKMALFLILSSVAILIIFAALLAVPKATVVLTVDAESLVQTFEVLASPSATAINKERKILPAVLLEVEEKGKQTDTATGKKEKGVKARGEVTIYNWTDDETNFPEGTALTLIRVEGEKLRFLLDEDITVPPQTASVSATPEERVTTYTPGKKTAMVVAQAFGEEYNLPAESQFSVSGLSTDELLAQNRDAFSGGKKEEVKVVTAADWQRLRERLSEELQKKAREDILSRSVGDQKLAEDAVFFDVLREIFNKEVDEEAEEFTLEITVKGSGILYSQDQLHELITSLLAENLPEGFEFSSEDFLVEAGAVTVERSDGGGVIGLKILAKVKAAVVPELNQKKIKQDLLGANLMNAENYLKSLPNVTAVRINLFPALPGPFRRLPRVEGRIDIVIKNE
jgi:hypothetical protein